MKTESERKKECKGAKREGMASERRSRENHLCSSHSKNRREAG